ncbi:MAG: response regulator [Nannocystaceae bacterium]|nr:response regulator [Nannocystaceae bacterium]
MTAAERRSSNLRWQANQSGRFRRDPTLVADFSSVLLVEDNPGDVELTKRALQQGPLLNHLHVVRDGNSALQALRNSDERTGGFAMILLDLNLPGMSGFDVLRELKADRELRRIPVMMLTTSSRRADIDKAYELGAASYVVKPVELARYVEIMSTIEAYRIQTVRLPTPSRSR